MIFIAYAIGIISGIAATAQASFNFGIRKSLRSPYITAATNFAVAWIAVLMIILVTEHGLHIPFGDIAKEPWWIWTGGVCGAFIIMTGIVCLPVLGSARNIMLLCFGQIMASLIIDQYGIFGAPVTPMTSMRVVGALLDTVGIALISVESNLLSFVRISNTGGADASTGRTKSDQSSEGNTSDPNNIKVLVLAIVDIVAGFAAAMQVAVNGTLAVKAGSAVKATLISMSGGILSMTLITCLIAIAAGKFAVFDEGKLPARPIRFKLLFLSGGAMAMIIVGGNAVTGPVLGTGIVTIMNLFGMMGAGLAADAVGFMGTEKKPVTLQKVAGMVLMLAGTALISFL